MRTGMQHRRAGFTLIEIMFALMLLGLVVAAIYSSWIAIIKGKRAGEKAAVEVQRARMAVHVINNALKCTRAFGGDIEYYYFIGENGSDPMLSFVANLPDSFPRSGKFHGLSLRRVTFSLEPGLDMGKELVMRQNPILMDLTKDERNFPVVLAKDVKTFAMEFWDKKQMEWTDEWVQTNQLPQKVKITLQFGGSSPGAPPRDPVTSIIDLQSVMVLPGWQMPGYSGGPPGGVLKPGQSTVPVGNP